MEELLTGLGKARTLSPFGPRLQPGASGKLLLATCVSNLVKGIAQEICGDTRGVVSFAKGTPRLAEMPGWRKFYARPPCRSCFLSLLGGARATQKIQGWEKQGKEQDPLVRPPLLRIQRSSRPDIKGEGFRTSADLSQYDANLPFDTWTAPFIRHVKLRSLD